MEKPAYQIVVEPDLLMALGEIVVILGQIDEDMNRTLTGILGVDRDTANRLMRTSEAIDLWRGAMQGRHPHEDFDAAVILAASEVKSVHKDRNDFIHADYHPAIPFQERWVTVRGSYSSSRAGSRKVLASRSREQRRRDVLEIAGLRERAARASRLVAHLAHAVSPHGSWNGSPWYASVEPFMSKAAKRPARTPRSATRVVIFDDVQPVPGD